MSRFLFSKILSIKVKLAITMALIALLPLVFVSIWAARVSVGRLQRSIEGQARDTSNIALNLLIRQVQRISVEMEALSGSPELQELLTLQPLLIPRYLQESVRSAIGGVVEVADRHGAVVARHNHMLEETIPFDAQAGRRAIERALQYERFASFAVIGEQLAIQIAAPIVDKQFVLRGAVLKTVLLDDTLAEFIKGVVYAEVGFLRGQTPVASTFVDEQGERLPGVSLTDAAEKRYRERSSFHEVRTLGGREYSLSFSPLLTVDGTLIGSIVVGLNRETLMRLQASTARSLVFGGVVALVLSVFFASLVGVRITRPLRRLHHQAQEVAAGNLDCAVKIETSDEIGQLASAFQSMTDSLRVNQTRLAAFSEQLEAQVRRRTHELQVANTELEEALLELKETQAQLIHSERMAGLGSLISGIAHEINTPTGAIHGAVQTLGETLERATGRVFELLSQGMTVQEVSDILEAMKQFRSENSAKSRSQLLPPAEIRRMAKALAIVLDDANVEDAERHARRLVEAGVGEMVHHVAKFAHRVSPELLVGFIEDHAFLERSSYSIQTATAALVRIVRALRSYAHTGRHALVEADLTEGLETTLTILHNELQQGVTVLRRYAAIPHIPVYVDELNQVWTNLIHNAVQAMQGKGQIVIETFQTGQDVGVKISDNGPGIPSEILPRIFEPFFSTKPRGQGTGLGLGIARKIIERHGGQIAVESRPGNTTFTVTLPLAGPQLSSPDLSDEAAALHYETRGAS